MADAACLKRVAERREGSSPSIPTIGRNLNNPKEITMKVFMVQMGESYDGVGLTELFSSKEAAINFAKNHGFVSFKIDNFFDGNVLYATKRLRGVCLKVGNFLLKIPYEMIGRNIGGYTALEELVSYDWCTIEEKEILG